MRDVPKPSAPRCPPLGDALRGYALAWAKPVSQSRHELTSLMANWTDTCLFARGPRALSSHLPKSGVPWGCLAPLADRRRFSAVPQIRQI